MPSRDVVLTASDIMVDFLQVTPRMSVRDTIKLMFEGNYMRVVVVDDGKLEGIVSTYDLVKRVLWRGKPLDTVEIKDIMTREVSFITPENDIKHIADLLYGKGIRCAPVVSEGVVVGIVSTRELGRIFAERFGHKYKAGDIMTYRYLTSTIHAPLDDFFKKMKVYGDRYLIVVSGEDREEIVGIVTPTDVLKYFYRMEGAELTRPHHIQEIMTKNPFIAKITDKCDNIANVMIERNISGVPVVDQKLEGLIRFRSFLEFLEV